MTHVVPVDSVLTHAASVIVLQTAAERRQPRRFRLEADELLGGERKEEIRLTEKGRPVSSAAKQALTDRGQRRALGLRARADGVVILSQTGY
jgi:hypothetical protein